MRDFLNEIWNSAKRNKLRTALTGFAVSWGIFILIVLLGAGNGLMNAFQQNGADFASNVMVVWGGFTTKPYNGLQEGRHLDLNDNDIKITRSGLFADHIDKVTASAEKSSLSMNYKDNYVSVSLCGCYPEYQEMEGLKMLAGRFINQNDMHLKRKCIVLPSSYVQTLLGDTADCNDIVGKQISVGNILYQAVGVYKKRDNMGSNSVYMPFTTYQIVFGSFNYADDISFTFHGLNTEEENEQFERQYRATLNEAHKADPEDEGTFWIWNRFTQNLQMEKGNSLIQKALWITGLFTLFGGIVGVSNIMLITVRERTYEFGIRKAIGATPWAIMKLIVMESVAITAFFGYLGMIAGLLACEVMKRTVGSNTLDMFGQPVQIFVNPSVGIDVAIGVSVVLVIAGTLAGLSPALKAARIRPVEALKGV